MTLPLLTSAPSADLTGILNTIINEINAGGAVSTPGGSNGQIQYNNNGAFGGVTTVGVANGGTGAATLTAHGVLIGAGTSAVAPTTAGTAGQVLTSNGASADPTFQTLTALPSNPPANAGATGVAGTITWDSGFIYVCVATNTWERVAIATW